MSHSPLVSVLMPVYNSGRYLAAAIESILAQTLTDFELIAVNDGSTDDSLEILEAYSQRDRRLRVFSQENQGIPVTRNRCLDLATGKYIAWMDSDDLSLPTRLEKQVAFLEANPDVGVCGTWVNTIDHSRNAVWRYEGHDTVLRSLLVFNSPFANSSTMMRRHDSQLADLRFDLSFVVSQDYDFWARASQLTAFTNLQEVLVSYRIHQQQVSNVHGERQLMFSGRVRQAQIARLGIQPSAEEFEIHQYLAQSDFQASRGFLTRAGTWLCRLHDANRIKGVFPEPAFTHVLAERWFLTCRAAIQLGSWAWKTYWASLLSAYYPMKFRSKVKFWTLTKLKDFS